MNRDNALFAVIGLLAGFIGGYVMQEVMSERQPARRVSGTSSAAAGGGGSSPATGGGQPAMEQVQQLARYVQENPEDAAAVRQLGDLNYDIQNWSRAAELYERYLKLQPGDVNVMTDLGASYRFLGEPQQALEKFRQIRGINPTHWQARYNEILVLGWDLGEMGAAQQALAELQSLQPDNPDVVRLAQELERRMADA